MRIMLLNRLPPNSPMVLLERGAKKIQDDCDLLDLNIPHEPISIEVKDIEFIDDVCE